MMNSCNFILEIGIIEASMLQVVSHGDQDPEDIRELSYLI